MTENYSNYDVVRDEKVYNNDRSKFDNGYETKCNGPKLITK